MMKLDELNWGKIQLNSLFKRIDRGKVSDLRNIDNGNMIIIAAAGVNEGFSCFSNSEGVAKDAMTISFNGVGTGTAFVHNYLFNLNSDCGLVIPHKKISVEALRFIAIAINMNKEKFHYGYKANENRLLRQTVLLPVDDKGEPDFEYMEQYVKHIKENKKELYKQYCEKQLRKIGDSVNVPALDKKKTLPFFVSDIFDVPKRGKRITSNKYIYGNTPVISSAGGNNGVIAFVGNKDNVRIYNDCLSVANGGVSAGFAFYHPYDFIGTDHITHFKNKGLNRFHYMFIGTIIRNQMHDKYDFSREMTDSRLKREILLLPVNDNNEPDYEYMEQYMKNIMIRKYNQYIEFKS